MSEPKMTTHAAASLVLVFAIGAAPASAAPAADYFSGFGNVEAKEGKPLDFPVDRVPGRALVKLEAKPGSAIAQSALDALADRTGIALTLVRPSLLGWGLYDVHDLQKPGRPDEAATLALVEALRDEPEIKGVSDDRWYRAQAVPNDPGFEDMWHLESIGAEAAWDTTQGTTAQRIGVVDTGTIRTHVELAAKDITGYDFIANGQQGGDGNGRDADYTDAGDGADCGQGYQPDSWHGTHVAGTILASSDNDEGIAGLNWHAGLVTARALGKCGGSTSDIMEGAAWMAGAEINGVPTIAAEDRVSVMNLSLGGPAGCSGYEQDVIDFITGQGTVFVAAAGNDGGAVGSPANCTGVVTVAAHGPSGNLTNYSSFGGTVEVVAPGGEIINDQEQGVLSAIGPGDESYGWFQGTSMAAPHVTGAVSLLQTLDPTLNRASLAQLFQDTGTTCGGCQGVPALALSALVDAVGGEPVDPGDPVDDPTPEPEPTPDDDGFEPNDGWDDAPSVVCGDGLDLVMAQGNTDWFKIDLAADQLLDVAIDGGDQDLDLYILDGPTNDDVVGSSTSPTGQEQTSFVVGAPTTVAIAVAPWEDASGPYTLDVTCTGGSEPEPEPEPEPEEPEEEDPNGDKDPIDPPEEEEPAPGDAPSGGDDTEAPDTEGPDDGEGDEQTELEAGDVELPRSDEGGDHVQSGCTQTAPSTAASFLGLLGLVGLLGRRRRR